MRTDRFRLWRIAAATITALVVMCGAAPIAENRAPAADAAANAVKVRFVVAAIAACIDRGVEASCRVEDISREELPGDLAHYRVLLKVGAGPYDAIAIHRLVRERHPGVPVHTNGSFFFLHGSSGHFTLSIDNDASLLGYLAQWNVDVWGIDLRWVRVPREQTDFAFMKDWDFGLQVSDVLLATRFARYARLLSGQRFDPVIVGGASLGASLAYAVANRDATFSPAKRDVGGLIALDTIYALPPGPGATRSLICQFETNYRTALAAGGYQLNSLAGIDAGIRALADPDGISPVNPSLTNRELALNTAASLTFAPALAFHNNTVVRGATGRPIDGRYTRPDRIFGILADSTPYRARATMTDYFAIPCGHTDVPYDDHLSAITVPILHFDFAGGFGKEGLYVLQLVGSQDVTGTFIQLQPDGQALDDFGHIDWLSSDDAQALVWEPIRSWVALH
jgi:pimeloyl-ACP methyl ester carboxylesterase